MPSHHATAEPPPLLQMLQALRLAHWHETLLRLCQRFDGWACDYLQQPESSPDYRPLGDVLRLVRRYPAAAAGNDESFAVAIGTCDFLARAARDKFQGLVAWNPFNESYLEFSHRFPERYPYWSSGPALSGRELTAWLLEQLDSTDGEAKGCSGVCEG